MEIDSIDPQWENFSSHLTENEKDSSELKHPSFNYIIEMQQLVQQIFKQLGRISANEHASIEKNKEKFMNSTLQSAELQVTSGKANRYWGCAAVLIGSFEVILPNSGDQSIVRMLSSRTPDLGGVGVTEIRSKMERHNADAQLAIEKYRAQVNTKSSGEGSKQEYTALLRAVEDLLKSSARA